MLLIAALLLWWAAFRLYLRWSDRYIVTHWQLDQNMDPWKWARCTLYLGYNDEKDWKQPATLTFEYRLFNRDAFPVLEFTQAGEEFDIKVSVGFWYIGRVWISLSRSPLQRFYRNCMTVHGYTTGIFLVNGISILWLKDKTASSYRPKPHLPRWIHVSHGMALGDDPGTGWDVTFDFDFLLRGDYMREEEILEVITNIPIPIEPDDSAFDKVYLGTWSYCREIRWRKNTPFLKTQCTYWKIDAEYPPEFSGKGENSWDQGDDAIYKVAYSTDHLPDAIWSYVRAVYQYRLKYGMPSWYHVQVNKTEQ